MFTIVLIYLSCIQTIYNYQIYSNKVYTDIFHICLYTCNHRPMFHVYIHVHIFFLVGTRWTQNGHWWSLQNSFCSPNKHLAKHLLTNSGKIYTAHIRMYTTYMYIKHPYPQPHIFTHIYILIHTCSHVCLHPTHAYRPHTFIPNTYNTCHVPLTFACTCTQATHTFTHMHINVSLHTCSHMCNHLGHAYTCASCHSHSQHIHPWSTYLNTNTC